MKVGDKVKTESLEKTLKYFGLNENMEFAHEKGTKLIITKISGVEVEAEIEGNEGTGTAWSYHKDDLYSKASKKSFEKKLQEDLLFHLHNLKVESCSFDLEFKSNKMIAGCQEITKQDALLIAKRILLIYGE